MSDVECPISDKKLLEKIVSLYESETGSYWLPTHVTSQDVFLRGFLLGVKHSKENLREDL